MAKEKKRGFFSQLGFGQKKRAPENETEVRNEEQQPVAEETAVVGGQPYVEETRSEAGTQAFVAEVVEVTEQVTEIEKLQQEEKPAAEQAQPEIEPVAESVAETAVETPAAVVIEREELPLPEEVKTEEVTVEEWRAEAEIVEIVEAAEEEIGSEPQLTGEELEVQALAAEVTEEAAMVVPVEKLAVEEPVEEEVVQEQEKPTKKGFFTRLKRSLLKTKESLGSGLISLFRGKKADDDLFEELEEQLLIADVDVEAARKIIANLTEDASREQLKDAGALYGLLKEEMGEIPTKVDEPLSVDGKTPFVILMVGVNSAGKTITIGKLARQFEQQGKSIMLAAGDTFRAAAVEQLQVWGQHNDIPVIAQYTSADSVFVIFDAIQAVKARNVDVLIADTAGHLQNESHLMEELKKIVRVMRKLDGDASHEVILIIDASTGQNAISRAKLFHEAAGLTGVTLTELDGTAKGEVIFSVADQFGIPIRCISVGERIEDLRPFKADDFIEVLFAREDQQ